MGRSAEAHLLLKGGRGEGKALQRFLILKEMELGGGTEGRWGWYEQEQVTGAGDNS